MDKFESELTRRYLLNSQSRGSLEEVVGEDENLDLEMGAQTTGQETMQEGRFSDQWEGKEETRNFFLQSYYQ
ncbi:hypothetical protein [Paenibacillus sanfengchensis]|uniref:hypothetical protein n=1 Tax=Paenibacillus sanfengchensis TaxID=3119819 RepID=UPI002FE38110